MAETEDKKKKTEGAEGAENQEEKKRLPPRSQSWEEWYLCARDYWEHNGDLLVERNYTTEDGFRLGRWIERQRAAYNGVGVRAGRIDSVQIAYLNSIGMVWKCVEHYSWAEWLSYVNDYYTTFGDLMVPRNYKTPEGVHLGDWIVTQRSVYAEGNLSKEHTDDLDHFDMIWYVGNRKRDWMDWYKDCIAYFETHGDLLVPVAYETATKQCLGTWIAVQRERAAGKGTRTPLTEEQRQKLDSLQMVWDLNDVRDLDWEKMYVWVREYKEQHGKLPLWPRGILAPDGRTMDSWIDSQRAYLRKGKHDLDHIQRLAKLGIVRPVPRSKPAAPPKQEV